MTQLTDHIAEAKSLLTARAKGPAPDIGTMMTGSATAALAHATLALVEQQRIANTIAYGREKREDLLAAGDRDQLLDWAHNGNGAAGYLSAHQCKQIGVLDA